MKFCLNQSIPLISFLLIPLLTFWNPSWLSLMGSQAYWPIFWLLPWAIIHGPFKSILMGLILGLFLDTIIADVYTQIPGLMLCGFWFGKVGSLNQFKNSPFQYGLTAAIGSLICGLIYFSQIVFNIFSENSPILFFSYGIQNIFSQILLTGLMAPFFCRSLYFLFSRKYKSKI